MYNTNTHTITTQGLTNTMDKNTKSTTASANTLIALAKELKRATPIEWIDHMVNPPKQDVLLDPNKHSDVLGACVAAVLLDNNHTIGTVIDWTYVQQLIPNIDSHICSIGNNNKHINVCGQRLISIKVSDISGELDAGRAIIEASISYTRQTLVTIKALDTDPLTYTTILKNIGVCVSIAAGVVTMGVLGWALIN